MEHHDFMGHICIVNIHTYNILNICIFTIAACSLDMLLSNELRAQLMVNAYP